MAYIFTDDNTKQEIEKGSPVVIDFWAEWCGPCKYISPIVDELAEAYKDKVLIGKYDVDDGSDLLAEYNVRNIPTILFFKDGKLADRNVGSITKDVLAKKIEAII
jgi:thioredoxin 1